MRIAAIAVVCALLPVRAWAQGAASVVPGNDVAAAVGWSGSDVGAERYDRWRGGVLASIGAGHYWTDHLKTEVDAAWSNSGTDEVYEDIEYSGGVTYAVSDQRVREIRVGVTQVYQFGRNAWVHPFAGVGVDLIQRETRTDRPAQTRTVYVAPNRTIPVTVPALNEQRRDVFAQAVLRAGLKMYATEKTFFSTEIKFGVRDDVDHVVWKVGIGVDF
jgi:hypothetical protein